MGVQEAETVTGVLAEDRTVGEDMRIILTEIRHPSRRAVSTTPVDRSSLRLSSLEHSRGQKRLGRASDNSENDHRSGITSLDEGCVLSGNVGASCSTPL